MLQLAVEISQADAEDPSGPPFVAADGCEDFLDMLSLNMFQGPEILFHRSDRRELVWCKTEMLRSDRQALRNDHRPFNHIGQLMNVANDFLPQKQY